ncbi:LytTR family DNA-binding domain-containing protein [Roseburia hominis]
MIRIALVEDNEELLKREVEIIKAGWECKEEMEVLTFSRAEPLIAALEAGEEYHILVADIGLPSMNGIELGKWLRARDAQIPLIYLTAYDCYALEGYEVEAYQYVMKEQMEVRLPFYLNKLGNRMVDRREKYWYLERVGEMTRVPRADVMYIKKDGKYVEFTTRSGKYRKRESLDAVWQEAEGFPFMKIERGYIINASHMQRIVDNNIVMVDGTVLPVSRRLLPKIKKEIHQNRSKL